MRRLSPSIDPKTLLATLCCLSLIGLAGCASGGDAPADEPPAEQAAEPSQPEEGDEYAEEMATQHADDSPTPSEAVATAGEDLPEGQQVTYAVVDGTEIQGYLVRPDGDQSAGPAIVVIHEWWGLNDNIRTMARKLADHGYTALAVDLYGGQSAQKPDQAKQFMQEAMAAPEQTIANLKQAVGYLEAQGAERIGVIGWCFGGGWSLQTALAVPEKIDAAVVYYGKVTTDPAALAALDAPLLGIFGAEDPSIPTEQVRAFEAALDEAGKTATIEIYEDAGHAFANPSGERYVPEAAEDAWVKTINFLDRHLKPEEGEKPAP